MDFSELAPFLLVAVLQLVLSIVALVLGRRFVAAHEELAARIAAVAREETRQ